jgi:type II secretory pathway component GspD/PulD (secretin)
LGNWPSWLHEGLAQVFSGDTSASRSRMVVEAMLKEKKLPKLSQLGQNWSGLNGAQAGVAYGYALYATEKLLEITASTGIGNVLRNPSGFSEVEADLERRLGL